MILITHISANTKIVESNLMVETSPRRISAVAFLTSNVCIMCLHQRATRCV